MFYQLSPTALLSLHVAILVKHGVRNSSWIKHRYSKSFNLAMEVYNIQKQHIYTCNKTKLELWNDFCMTYIENCQLNCSNNMEGYCNIPGVNVKMLKFLVQIM